MWLRQAASLLLVRFLMVANLRLDRLVRGVATSLGLLESGRRTRASLRTAPTVSSGSSMGQSMQQRQTFSSASEATTDVRS